ncbi:uncharacterized protein LOC109535110 [Dendroctonus ponderosae]|uniref:uncharacterized protein LOC109535110 n=1 Tax=Dendroctonus ponderosae TaxID=77166 RepID=UPI00203639F9|nr:uncharacterized protein LOC109535110 [Dendroctonus ponderosae]KAH1009429.1 hypothetical protein HUJ04_001786 [Dendroctonus ponderosae]KAH1009430.1 hypothetical protein HUJ04_001786 [Dendroctonus ponderosae]KAH1017419.1 hypothetical protein HUJ05_008062 [Dendroctonus ponderosae]KAH1017420.1 hypothetical protein HUJ05_008062 [Dendroctonus ponderosae]
MGRKIWVLALVIIAAGADALKEDDEDTKEEMEIYKVAIDFVDECGSKELSLCVKERVLKYIDALPNELDIGGGVKVKPNGRLSRKNELEALPEEPRAREDAVESILWDRVADYLSSHTIEIKVPPDAIQELQHSVDEGRGKGGGGGGKKGGGGGDRVKGLMMLIQLKAAILGALALKFVAIVAFKALIVAKVAFTIASIIALKKLLEQKHHTSTYEVLAHPHHEEYGHFDRSFTQEQLAYKGYEGAARSKN